MSHSVPYAIELECGAVLQDRAGAPGSALAGRGRPAWAWTPDPHGLLAAVLLAIVAAALPAAAQCIVDNPGGSKMNINRPADADVPAASFSPLSAVNDDLPQWLCFSAGYRMRFEGYTGGSFQADNSDSYLLTRFRLGVLIKPLSWFRVYAELQDADSFWKTPPLGPPYQSTWDLRRAYVDLGDSEQQPVSFRVGRQDLNFGYGRLVGTSYWRNASRGFDAASMLVHWSRLRVTTFAASQVVIGDNGLSHHQPGNNLYGLYGSLKDIVPDSVIEPYLFWRLSPGVKEESGEPANLDDKTLGLRFAGTETGFDYDAEADDQFGNIGTNQVRAWAWTAITGYTFQPVRFKPRVFGEYDFASGDRNPKDGIHGTFDQLYPNIHDHHGLADQVAWENLKELRSGARFSLRRNWTIAGMYNDWWLASAKDAFYNSSGGIVARDATGRSGTHIGEELDAETTYRINQQLELGSGIGRILPGGFLAATGHNHPYTYPYVMLNYNFY